MKCRPHRLLLSALLLSIGYLLLAAHPIQAQSADLGLKISPPLTIKEASLGKPIDIPLTLTNTADRQVQLTPMLYAFTSDGHSGRPIIDLSLPSTLGTLHPEGFTFGQPFTLQAGQSQQFTITIIPPSPLRADLTLTALFHSAAGTQEGNGVRTSGGIGSNIIITADSMYIQNHPVEIASIALPKIIDMFTPIAPTITVRNPSSSRQDIRGIVRVRGIFGDIIALAAVFPDTILGDSTRVLRQSKKQESLNLPEPIVFDSLHLPGKYALETEVRSASESATQARVVFYVLPLRLIAITIILSLCLTLAYRFFQRESDARHG